MIGRTRRGALRHQRGQATVEFALMLPMIVMGAWLPVAAGSVVTAQMDLATATRNAAREAAMSPDPAGTALDTARASTSLRPLRTRTAVSAGLVRVEVTARYRLPLLLPRALTPAITLSSRAAVSTEMFIGSSTGEDESS